ncbi:MAG: hypothetical protein WC785_10990 [Tatlockia sp.]
MRQQLISSLVCLQPEFTNPKNGSGISLLGLDRVSWLQASQATRYSLVY